MRFVHLELAAAQSRAAGFVVPCERGAVSEVRDAGIHAARADFGERQIEHAVIGDSSRRRAGRRQIWRFERERDGQFVDAGRRASHQHVAAAEVRADAIGETFGFGDRPAWRPVRPTATSDRVRALPGRARTTRTARVTATSAAGNFMIQLL